MAPSEEYSRADVRRKFGLSERQLRSWEQQGLVPAAESYSFSDLIAIQTLIKLRENHIQGRQIGRALESLRQKLSWVKQPLSELRIVSDGRKIAVHVAGQKMEAMSGQILFDFDAAELGGVQRFRNAGAPPTACGNPKSGFKRASNWKRRARPWKRPSRHTKRHWS